MKKVLFLLFFSLLGFVCIAFLTIDTPKNYADCIVRYAPQALSDKRAAMVMKSCEKIFFNSDDCEKDISKESCASNVKISHLQGKCALGAVLKSESDVGAQLAFLSCETKASYKVWKIK